MILLTPIFNRGADGKFKLPEDGWYHLVPKGEFPHAESGTLQVIDDESITAILNRFAEESKKPNFAGMLIDQEHFSYDNEKSSEAYGWIKELQNRADGIWGRIDWTDVGQPAVQSGRYRFISPTWLPKDVVKLGNKRIRPLRLDRAGMTNVPNLKGMVPLSNRAGSGDLADSQTQTQNKKMNKTAILLGLSAEASEDAILAEVTKLLNRANKAEADLVPLTNRVKELEKTTQDQLAIQVENDLVKYKNRFKAEKRDHWKTALIANRDTAIALLESIEEPKIVKPAAPIHNREGAQAPTEASVEAHAQQAADEQPFLNRAKELMDKKNISFAAAATQIAQTEPALYKEYTDSLGKGAK